MPLVKVIHEIMLECNLNKYLSKHDGELSQRQIDFVAQTSVTDVLTDKIIDQILGDGDTEKISIMSDAELYAFMVRMDLIKIK